MNLLGDEHRGKVHVNTSSSLTNNSSPAESDVLDSVSRHILVAERLRQTMLMACAGEFAHIDPARAQAFIEATADLYSGLDQLHKSIVERNNQPDQLDMLLVIFSLSKLETHVDSFLDPMPLAKGNA